MVRVSTVIPAYNASRYVTRALASVFAQRESGSEIEIIVVNDGSTDDTASVLAAFGQKINVVHQANRGQSAARNEGIRRATGDYIAFLDADDEWRPTKLQRQLEVMRSNPRVGLVSSGASRVDAHGREESPGRPHRMRGDLLNSLLLGNFVVTSSVLVRRTCLDSLGELFRTDLPVGEDWELWLRLSSICDFEILPEILVNYFSVPDSAGKRVDPQTLGEIYRHIYRLLLTSPSTRPAVARQWNHLQANSHYLTASLHLDRGEVSHARTELLRAIALAPSKIRWSLLFLIVSGNPGLRSRLRRVGGFLRTWTR